MSTKDTLAAERFAAPIARWENDSVTHCACLAGRLEEYKNGTVDIFNGNTQKPMDKILSRGDRKYPDWVAAEEECGHLIKPFLQMSCKHCNKRRSNQYRVIPRWQDGDMGLFALFASSMIMFLAEAILTTCLYSVASATVHGFPRIQYRRKVKRT